MKLKKALTLAVVIIGLLIFSIVGVNRFVHQKVSEQVAKLHSQGILITYDDLSLNVFARSVTIDNLTLIDIKDSSYHIKSSKVTVSGIGLMKLYKKESLSLNSVSISDGDVVLWKRKKTKKEKSTKPLPVFINSISLSDCRILMIDEVKKVISKNINIELRNCSYQNEQIKLDLPSLETGYTCIVTPQDFTSFKSVTSKGGSSYEIETLCIGKVESVRKILSVPTRETPFYSRVNKLVVTLTLNDLLKGVVHINYAYAQRGYIRAFSNLNKPVNQNRYINLPHSSLWDSLGRNVIDSLKVENFEMSYTAIMKAKTTFSSIHFNDINLTAKLDKDHGLFRAHTKLENIAPFSCNLNFIRKNKNTYFEGSLAPFNLMALSPMLQRMASVEVEKGYCDGLTFKANADSMKSIGSMEFKYHDLDIEFEKTGLINSSKKFIFNKFLEIKVPKNNPGLRGEVRVGEVAFERDPHRAIFYFLWKSIQMGLHTSLKLPPSSVKK